MGRFHRHDGQDGHTHEHTHVLADGTVVTHSHDHHHEGDHAHPHDHPHSHHTDLAGDQPHPQHPYTGSDVHQEYGDHSGYKTGAERVSVLEDIFAENDGLAQQNREDFDRAGRHRRR